MELTESDTLRLPLPSGMDLASVRLACSRFGSIERAEQVDGKFSEDVEVVFFDVREAKTAAATLKPLGCTVVLQSKLKRSVTLPGSLELEVQDLVAVANVLNEGDEEGSYTVQFFDSRVAARYLKEEDVIDPGPPGLELPPGLDVPPGLQSRAADLQGAKRGAPGAEAKSRKSDRNCERLPPGLQSASARPASTESRSTSASSSKLVPQGHYSVEAFGEFNVKPPREYGLTQEYQVRVSGLPKAILSDDMMEVMFEQANLERELLEYTLHPEESTGRGEALVRLATRAAAERCARHFNGRRWDASGVAVSATIVGAEPAESGSLSAAAPVFVPMLSGLSSNAAGQALSANAPVFVPKQQQAFVAAPTPIGSDQSTDTGDSGSDDDKETGTASVPLEPQSYAAYSL